MLLDELQKARDEAERRYTAAVEQQRATSTELAEVTKRLRANGQPGPAAVGLASEQAGLRHKLKLIEFEAKQALQALAVADKHYDDGRHKALNYYRTLREFDKVFGRIEDRIAALHAEIERAKNQLTMERRNRLDVFNKLSELTSQPEEALINDPQNPAIGQYSLRTVFIGGRR